MRTASFVLGFLAAILSVASAPCGENDKTIHPVVVELFTSQGCNDCPPADRLLAEISQRRDVIALTLPITYWDMLGWKDTFATATNTQRQKNYAHVMGHSGIYTPQMIVDGVKDVVGNQRAKVMAAIAERSAVNERSAAIPIAIATSDDSIQIAIAGNPESVQNDEIHVWIMRTRSQARVDVDDGENSGKTLYYVNLVREMKDIGRWNGGPKVFSLPIPLRNADRDGLVVILQSRTLRQIIGAAMIQSPDRVDAEDSPEEDE